MRAIPLLAAAILALPATAQAGPLEDAFSSGLNACVDIAEGAASNAAARAEGFKPGMQRDLPRLQAAFFPETAPKWWHKPVSGGMLYIAHDGEKCRVFLLGAGGDAAVDRVDTDLASWAAVPVKTGKAWSRRQNDGDTTIVTLSESKADASGEQLGLVSSVVVLDADDED